MSTALHAPGDGESPFHEGEQRLQALTGRREKMETVGRAFIRGFMPDQHRDFFAQLPFIVVGGLDAARKPWATVWAGTPGFMHSSDPTILRIRQPHVCTGDPLAGLLAGLPHGGHDAEQGGAPIGLLGIEPHTRRRNRLNGTLRRVGIDSEWALQVRQSFGNCPKYIQPRRLTWREGTDETSATTAKATAVQRGSGALPPHVQRLVRRADTFFIASSSPAAGEAHEARHDGVDVSHRGGESGFVHIADEAEGGHPPHANGRSTLIVPDYSGNFMFNTLGNILLQPLVGLLFIDFASGDMLWLAGHGALDLDSPRIADFAGAQRLLRVRVDEWILAEGALPLRVHADG
jgi:predicted pyridoxine 5'-phosphate oxidase superfamily flavin-nucleotide-binding protein